MTDSIGDIREQIKEIQDRLTYFYLQTDGSYDFPNSREGDLLKMVHRSIPLLQSAVAEADRLARIKELEYFLEVNPNTLAVDFIAERLTELRKKVLCPIYQQI